MLSGNSIITDTEAFVECVLNYQSFQKHEKMGVGGGHASTHYTKVLLTSVQIWAYLEIWSK